MFEIALWQIILLLLAGGFLVALLFISAILLVETHISTVVNCTIARLSAEQEMERWHERGNKDGK